ncbi:hypothetical protein CBM2608_B70071 [Cupriavidus taiwanensis]|nr:hypothetical protein CBM2608_B70071 [Cupriavidus taiwanensis]
MIRSSIKLLRGGRAFPYWEPFPSRDLVYNMLTILVPIRLDRQLFAPIRTIFQAMKSSFVDPKNSTGCTGRVYDAVELCRTLNNLYGYLLVFKSLD